MAPEIGPIKLFVGVKWAIWTFMTKINLFYIPLFGAEKSDIGAKNTFF